VKTKAADILIDTISDWGVELVFGLPGDGINGIVEALRKRADKIRFIQDFELRQAAVVSGQVPCKRIPEILQKIPIGPGAALIAQIG
jgi:hypothetical protein